MMISISSFIFIIIACFFVFLIFFVRRNIKVRWYYKAIILCLVLLRKAMASLCVRTSASGWCWAPSLSWPCSASSTTRPSPRRGSRPPTSRYLPEADNNVCITCFLTEKDHWSNVRRHYSWRCPLPAVEWIPLVLLGKWMSYCIVVFFHFVYFPWSDSHGEAQYAGQQVYVREQVTVLNIMR